MGATEVPQSSFSGQRCQGISPRSPTSVPVTLSNLQLLQAVELWCIACKTKNCIQLSSCRTDKQSAFQRTTDTGTNR